MFSAAYFLKMRVHLYVYLRPTKFFFVDFVIYFGPCDVNYMVLFIKSVKFRTLRVNALSVWNVGKPSIKIARVTTPQWTILKISLW